MTRSIRGRLVRLERARGVYTTDPTRPSIYFWDILSGAKNADDLLAADRAHLESWWEDRCQESKGYRIAAVQKLVDLLRTDSALQEVPTAGELVDREDRERGFCVFEELLRILPSSQEAGR